MNRYRKADITGGSSVLCKDDAHVDNVDGDVDNGDVDNGDGDVDNLFNLLRSQTSVQAPAKVIGKYFCIQN